VGRKRILGNKQFKALTDWFAQHRDRPKFVVSPSVVVPFLKETRKEAGRPGYPGRSDGWDGYPDQLERLFSFIFRESIDNVVFLCGDSHLAMHSEIWFEDFTGQPQPLKAHCIMASPMYAPYPFANATVDEFVLDNAGERRLTLPGLGFMHYRAELRAARNSFTVATAEKDRYGRWQVKSEVMPAEPRAEDPAKAHGRAEKAPMPLAAQSDRGVIASYERRPGGV
jgi:phosphodiesterase/alkaline phosphatase D-like protein